MPPTPPQPAAEPPVEGNAPPARPSLRGIPAGYDLDAVPIHLPPHRGESTLSWTRRLAVRYDVPVRDLLRHAGARRNITSSRGVTTRLRTYPGMAARLGLTAEQIEPLVKIQPLAKATLAYADAFGHPTPNQPQSRYCPRCLAEPDPWWPDHWQSPLSWICPIHHSYLVNACPRCGQPPHARRGWIGRVIDLHRCPSQLPASSHTGRRRLRDWCNADLTTTPTQPAPAGAVASQQLLHDWATDPSNTPVTVAGLVLTHRLVFQALVELIDAASPGFDILNLASDPQEAGPGLTDAHPVVTATDLTVAAGQATMLSYDARTPPSGPTGGSPATATAPCLQPSKSPASATTWPRSTR